MASEAMVMCNKSRLTLRDIYVRGVRCAVHSDKRKAVQINPGSTDKSPHLKFLSVRYLHCTVHGHGTCMSITNCFFFRVHKTRRSAAWWHAEFCPDSLKCQFTLPSSHKYYPRDWCYPQSITISTKIGGIQRQHQTSPSGLFPGNSIVSRAVYISKE